MKLVEQPDFARELFGNPLYFIAFLTEVIDQTVLATLLTFYKIIFESASKQMGISIDIEQLILIN